MTDRYILDEMGIAHPEPDLMRWGRWFETANRQIAQTEIGDACVSTVFLGLDHSFGRGDPLLFETMIFGGSHDQYQERYTTRTDALLGHAKAVAMAREPTS